MRSDSLYFGTTKPSAGKVLAEEWQSFLNQVVTPRFQDGLTIFKAQGQWKSKDGQILSEQSYVLNIIHRGTPKENQAFTEIIAEYKRRFSQDSVLQVSTAACAAF